MSRHGSAAARTRAPGGERTATTECLPRFAAAGCESTEAQTVREWLPFAYSIAVREFYLPGGDRDDVRQEAALGLLSAVRSYKPETGTPFSAFVCLVVRRRLSSALRLAHGQKHTALNGACELLDEHDAVGGEDPAILAEQRADIRRLAECDLSPLERRAVTLIAAGATYREVRELTGGSLKSVDNALTRARRKLAA
jgi:RNA polymerase sporulation-specific sigma factor